MDTLTRHSLTATFVASNPPLMKPALHATHLNRFYAAVFVLVLLVNSVGGL